jgi:CheY-like chemotaxis protein/Tfp pilus assembly protein PilF
MKQSPAPSAVRAPFGKDLRAGGYDPELASTRALVIDANPTSRSILSAQLRDLGVGTVVQCGRVQDARRQLEAREFDIVLCEQDFRNESYTGQALLDDLRRGGLLPFSTVFVMVTAEASYTAVADAAESALDSYLLKPHTAYALADRIQQARHRKRVLRDIFVAIEEGEFDTAARLCLQRFQARSPYWLYAARIGAELLLRLGQHGPAKTLYEAVIATQALPWARLGVARAQVDAGQAPQARRTLENLIADQPGFSDAYDVMGRAQVEQGQFEDALATYRTATQLTPGSIARLQRQGMLAFYLGQKDEAQKVLERASLLGISSKMFDLQSIVLLAITRFVDKDSKGLQRCIDNLAHALERAPDSSRVRRFHDTARVFSLMLGRQVPQAVVLTRELAAQVRAADFDFEAACNLASLLAHLTAAELKLDAAEDWIDAVALRFSTTRSLADLLGRAATVHPPYVARIREGHAQVTALAEQAMNHTLNGQPRAAVETLLQHGERTMNAKLVDMAGLVLQRHRERIDGAEALAAVAERLKARHGACGITVAPLTGDGPRASGGVALRARVDPGRDSELAPPSTILPGADGPGIGPESSTADASPAP